MGGLAPQIFFIQKYYYIYIGELTKKNVYIYAGHPPSGPPLPKSFVGIHSCTAPATCIAPPNSSSDYGPACTLLLVRSSFPSGQPLAAGYHASLNLKYVYKFNPSQRRLLVISESDLGMYF